MNTFDRANFISKLNQFDQLIHAESHSVLLLVYFDRILVDTACKNASTSVCLQCKHPSKGCFSHPSYPQDRAYEIVEDTDASKMRKMKKRLCLVLDCLCAHDYSDKTADLINLQHYVIKEKRLSEREAIVIFYDVVRVVEALHKVNVDGNSCCTTSSVCKVRIRQCFCQLFRSLLFFFLSTCTFLITHFPFSCATPRTDCCDTSDSQSTTKLLFFLPTLSCLQKNIVHRDLKLGNMVLNKR